MNTLRTKLTLLIVSSILFVVCLATWITFLLVEQPSFSIMIDANAEQIQLLLDQNKLIESLNPQNLNQQKQTAKFGIKDHPASGRIIGKMTRDLRIALARRNLPAQAVVTSPKDSPWPVASITLDKSGKVFVIPLVVPPPPPDIPPILLAWLSLIATGATVIVTIFVFKLTRPLAILQKTVANITPESDLPILPETGPEEARDTAKAINLLSSLLKKSMESRMRLVAAAGHDLRTPMTRMRLRAEFLESEERDKWLEDLDELDHIADNAISLVREEVGQNATTPVQLDNLLSETVSELTEQNYSIRINNLEEAGIIANSLSLKRALRNLLINASTYGKAATVSMHCDDKNAIIKIEDQGPGIPDELMESAFEPFFRVDQARTSGKGAGLGLSIAKEIIQRINGKIELTNRKCGGLMQIITIPLKQ